MSYSLMQERSGKWSLNGVEQPAGEIVKKTDEFIVLKVPGHHYWSGRGMPSSYAGAEYQLFRLVEDRGTYIYVDRLLEFPVKPNKEGG